jgi:hypothetical protein
LSSRRPSITSPTGSGRAAISNTSRAIAATRSGVSVSRSINAAETPASLAASTSRPLATSTSAARSVSAAEIAFSASLRVPASVRASTRDASFAAAQVSATPRAAARVMGSVAIGARVPAAAGYSSTK